MDEYDGDVRTGYITGIRSSMGSGLATIAVARLVNGRMGHDRELHIEAGFGLRQVARAFGSLGDAIGQEIAYTAEEPFGLVTSMEPTGVALDAATLLGRRGSAVGNDNIERRS